MTSAIRLKESLWATQRKPHYQKALRAAGKKLREFMGLNRAKAIASVTPEARAYEPDEAKRTPPDAPRGGRAFVDMSDHLDGIAKVKATSEIATRLAAAKRSNGAIKVDDNGWVSTGIPTSEWSPTIGQPEAANSDGHMDAQGMWHCPRDPYTTLRAILDAAFNHAATGKGKERHARDLPFDEQPMLETTRLVGPGFPLGQAIKKAGEAAGMIGRGELDAAEAECLGAINYLAGAVAWMREQQAKVREAA